MPLVHVVRVVVPPNLKTCAVVAVPGGVHMNDAVFILQCSKSRVLVPGVALPREARLPVRVAVDGPAQTTPASRGLPSGCAAVLQPPVKYTTTHSDVSVHHKWHTARGQQRQAYVRTRVASYGTCGAKPERSSHPCFTIWLLRLAWFNVHGAQGGNAIPVKWSGEGAHPLATDERVLRAAASIDLIPLVSQVTEAMNVLELLANRFDRHKACLFTIGPDRTVPEPERVDGDETDTGMQRRARGASEGFVPLLLAAAVDGHKLSEVIASLMAVTIPFVYCPLETLLAMQCTAGLLQLKHKPAYFDKPMFSDPITVTYAELTGHYFEERMGMVVLRGDRALAHRPKHPCVDPEEIERQRAKETSLYGYELVPPLFMIRGKVPCATVHYETLAQTAARELEHHLKRVALEWRSVLTVPDACGTDERYLQLRDQLRRVRTELLYPLLNPAGTKATVARLGVPGLSAQTQVDRLFAPCMRKYFRRGPKGPAFHLNNTARKSLLPLLVRLGATEEFLPLLSAAGHDLQRHGVHAQLKYYQDAGKRLVPNCSTLYDDGICAFAKSSGSCDSALSACHTDIEDILRDHRKAERMDMTEDAALSDFEDEPSEAKPAMAKAAAAAAQPSPPAGFAGGYRFTNPERYYTLMSHELGYTL